MNDKIKELRQKIVEIMYLSMICEKMGYHCFIEYSPHVSKVRFQLYYGEWIDGLEPDETEIELDCPEEEIESEIEKVNKVGDELKTTLENLGIDYLSLY